MRMNLIGAVLGSILLSACGSTRSIDTKHDFQPGPLKVHPGLLGQPLAETVAQPRPLPATPVVEKAMNPAVAVPTEAASDARVAMTGLMVSKDLTAALRAERSFYFTQVHTHLGIFALLDMQASPLCNPIGTHHPGESCLVLPRPGTAGECIEPRLIKIPVHAGAHLDQPGLERDRGLHIAIGERRLRPG